MKSAIYTYHFRRYLGRNLTRAEAAVIGPLEKMRIRASSSRLYGGRMERGFQPSQPTTWPATAKTVAPYRLTRPRDRAALQTFKKSFVLLPLFSSVLSLC